MTKILWYTIKLCIWRWWTYSNCLISSNLYSKILWIVCCPNEHIEQDIVDWGTKVVDRTYQLIRKICLFNERVPCVRALYLSLQKLGQVLSSYLYNVTLKSRCTDQSLADLDHGWCMTDQQNLPIKWTDHVVSPHLNNSSAVKSKMVFFLYILNIQSDNRQLITWNKRKCAVYFCMIL